MTYAATLTTALTLAQAGAVTSVTRGRPCRLTVPCAAWHLMRYASHGYLLRVSPGRPYYPAEYAITLAGTERLTALCHAKPQAPNAFAPLLLAWGNFSHFGAGATGG